MESPCEIITGFRNRNNRSGSLYLQIKTSGTCNKHEDAHSSLKSADTDPNYSLQTASFLPHTCNGKVRQSSVTMPFHFGNGRSLNAKNKHFNELPRYCLCITNYQILCMHVPGRFQIGNNLTSQQLQLIVLLHQSCLYFFNGIWKLVHIDTRTLVNLCVVLYLPAVPCALCLMDGSMRVQPNRLKFARRVLVNIPRCSPQFKVR